MPSCKRCGYEAATSYFRRSPKGGYLCVDRESCAHDRKVKAKGGDPGPRSLQSLLRF